MNLAYSLRQVLKLVEAIVFWVKDLYKNGQGLAAKIRFSLWFINRSAWERAAVSVDFMLVRSM